MKLVSWRWLHVGRVVLPALTLALTAGDTGAQSIVEVYQRQRLLRVAERSLEMQGGRYMVLPPQYLPAPLDTIPSPLDSSNGSDAATGNPPMMFDRWQRIPKLGQPWFNKRFADREWVFAGNSRVAPLDTMLTRDIRARLEAHFGKPTRTLGDLESRAGVSDGTIFEFEYWFVLNDSIPLVITDVNGPFERGIAASTTIEFGEDLLRIRNGFLNVLAETLRRAPFVDYYYDDEEQQWYLAGYDGREFFVRPIPRPGFGRPVLPHRTSEQRE